MLLLTLKTDKSFTVDVPGKGKFTVKVIESTRNRVVLGIAAPYEFKILRSELENAVPDVSL